MKTSRQASKNIDLSACRRVLWKLFVHSCTVDFVLVFARILALLNLNPSPFPLFSSSSFPFHHSSFMSLRWVQLCSRLAQHWFAFARFAVISMVASVFLDAFAMGLLRRFLYPILDTLVFVPNTCYTHNVSMYGLVHNLGLHTCFGSRLKPWFEQKPCLCVKTVFTQRLCYTLLFGLAGWLSPWWPAEHAQGVSIELE